jgi:hypothetical protein
MFKKSYLLAIAVLASLAFSHSAVAGKLFGDTELDPVFCKNKTFRQTVVYIDDKMMVDGKTDWARKVSGKLKSTLTAGERVTVVRLSPDNGQSSEIWTGCWPSYTSEQKESLSKQSYIFTENPAEGIDQQQAFFMKDLNDAIVKIYSATKRSDADIADDQKNLPKKQILRALASDETRFSTSNMTIRAIIYSNMQENSDLGSVYTALPQPFPDYADKLGSRFKNGIFYAFGVGGDTSNQKASPEAVKTFWEKTFVKMQAVLAGMGADLSVANSMPVKAYNYNVHLDFKGQDLEGRMPILVADDGTLVDSWIGFTRMSIAGLSGTFSCQSELCKLDTAPTTNLLASNDTTKRAAETIKLSGKEASLSGQAGVQGAKPLSFELKATLPATQQ